MINCVVRHLFSYPNEMPTLYLTHICSILLPHVSVCLHHIQEELSIPYSKPSACTELLPVVHWLHHKI